MREQSQSYRQLSCLHLINLLVCLCLLGQVLVQPLAVMAAPLPEEEEATALAAPVLIGPNNGIITTGSTHPPVGMPRLSWEPVVGADYYSVEISTSAGFAHDTVEATTYATTYIPEAILYDGTYYWRVRAGVNRDEWSLYSEEWTFTKDWGDDGRLIPQLKTPPDGAERAAFTNDDFTWEPFVGAAKYFFEISSDPNFSTIVYDVTTLKAAHTPTERLASNTYYWRVTPIDKRGNHGVPSNPWSFDFNWKYAPKLLSPAPNVDSSFIPRFSWTAVEAAEKYELQISTQQDFASSATNIYQSANTEYTPEKALSNDQDYYWRVKAIDYDDNSTPWSEVRQFRIRWNFQTEQLVPNNGVIRQSNPFFSWTPMPGAERYQLQVDESNSFERPLMDEEFYNTTTAAIVKIEESTIHIDRDYFWRVRGVDAQGYYTPWSKIQSFRYGYIASPNLIYPLPYYEPDTVNTPVYSDRTVAWPLFIWDNAIEYDTTTSTVTVRSPQYYEVTVAADIAFSDVRFTVDTTGSHATPTDLHPFTNLEDGKLYYWRVRAFYANNEQLGVDHVWMARFDRTVPERPYSTEITPIFPAPAAEAVEIPPLLGWLPVTGAANYRVQISTKPDFSTIAEEVMPQFVNYAPWQGKRTPMPSGTYYWRVRAESAPNVPLGDWSEVRHFNLSVDLVMGNPYDTVSHFPAYPQSILYTPGGLENPTRVASNDTPVADDAMVTDLHIALNQIDLRGEDYPITGSGTNDWIFAFGASPTISEPVRYILYVDEDHVPGSGGTVDPLEHPITVDSLYLPESVLVVERNGNSVTADDVTFYDWGGTNWLPGQSLDNRGGDAWYSASENAIQLIIPDTTFDVISEVKSGSLAVVLFSTTTDSQMGIRQSIPTQDGNNIGSPVFVSNMLMPLYPFDTPLSNPYVHEDMPPLRWRMPYYDSIDGYQIEVATDAQFTSLEEEWEVSELRTGSLFSFLTTTFQPRRAYENNESLYWRVRLRYERATTKSTEFGYGPWSPTMRFKLDSREVANPTLSTGNLAETTPSFWWDRVEGAAGYTLQIDDDQEFSSPKINVKVDGTSYTPLKPLADGNYFWRVVMRRSRTVMGRWSPAMPFVKQSLAPTLLTPINDQIVNDQPTFKWTAVLTPTDQPRVAAPRYRFEIDEEANFGSPLTDYTQATSYTLPGHKSNLFDATFYWRVAVVDSAGNIGTYSEPQQFYKEYLTPKPISPISNTTYTKDGSFSWEPMDGAAYYQIEIDDDPSFGRPDITAKPENTVYTPIREMSKPQYYWRVRMVDDKNNFGPWAGGKINIDTTSLTLGNYVWIDNNNNGKVDADEEPVPNGVILELLDGAGAYIGKTDKTIRGFYLFDELGPAEYRVRLAAENFAVGGKLYGYRHSTGVFQESDPNSNGDQNDNGLDDTDPAVDGIMSPKISLTLEEPTGETPTSTKIPGDDGTDTEDAHSNLTLDFGVVPPTVVPGAYAVYLPLIER